MIKLIVATDLNGIIGKENSIPWNIKEDMKFFKKTTYGHVLIMGRKTWDSLGRKCLPGRKSIVITRNAELRFKFFEDTIFVDEIEKAISIASLLYSDAFVIGGSQIYKEALEKDLVDVALVSHIKDSYDGDARFPIELLENKDRTLIKTFNDFEVYEYQMKG